MAIFAYNHEAFIAQAIDSVLMQETTFPIELVIGEDCSTDGTRRIVEDYARRHPERVRLVLHPANVGGHANYMAVLKASRGEFIALLDGDDFWTSPHKLQRQVEFLANHRECSMCAHPVKVFREDVPTANWIWPTEVKSMIGLEDLLRSLPFHTGSVMFRNGLLAAFPEWFGTLSMGDWTTFILYAEHGKVGMMSDVMGAYRVHPRGSWSSLDATVRYASNIEMYECIDTHFARRYAHIIYPILAGDYFSLGAMYDQRGESHLARTCIRKSLAYQLWNRQLPRLDALKMLLRLSMPAVYAFMKRLSRRER